VWISAAHTRETESDLPPHALAIGLTILTSSSKIINRLVESKQLVSLVDNLSLGVQSVAGRALKRWAAFPLTLTTATVQLSLFNVKGFLGA
jgi:hypothetical protein